jgi:hypothetical protein
MKMRDQTDLAFGFQITTEERTAIQTIYTGWGGYGFGTERYRDRLRSSRLVATSTTSRIDYTVGTLIIAAFGVGGNELVWQSSGSGTIDPARSADASRERINDAVQRIMRDFPPGS